MDNLKCNGSTMVGRAEVRALAKLTKITGGGFLRRSSPGSMHVRRKMIRSGLMKPSFP
jgi:hypothetical protein